MSIHNEPPMAKQLEFWREEYHKALAAGEGEVGAKLLARHKLMEWIAKYQQEQGDAYEP